MLRLLSISLFVFFSLHSLMIAEDLAILPFQNLSGPISVDQGNNIRRILSEKIRICDTESIFDLILNLPNLSTLTYSATWIQNWATLNNYKFVVVGQIKSINNICEVDLDVYNFGSENIKQKFYEKDFDKNIESMANFLALKIISYFYKVFMIADKNNIRSDRVEINTALSGFIPLNEKSLLGLGSMSIGIDFIFQKPFGALLSSLIFPRIGFNTSYGLMINSPLYKGGLFHSIKMALPMAILFDSAKDSFYLEFALNCELAILRIDRSYEDALLIIITNPGLALGLGYDHYFDEAKHFAIGAFISASIYPSNNCFTELNFGLRFRYMLREFNANIKN